MRIVVVRTCEVVYKVNQCILVECVVCVNHLCI